MKLTISAEGKAEVERMILIMILGLSTALEKNLISIEEAENFLYSPYSMERLKKIGLDENLVKLINLGCELENVERLIPNKLQVSIQEMKETSLDILDKMPKAIIPAKKWIE